MNLDYKISRPLCRDKKKTTPRRILEIVRSKGSFVVSWRYRDEALMKACRKLAKEGLLYWPRKQAPGSTIFYKTQKGLDALKELQ